MVAHQWGVAGMVADAARVSLVLSLAARPLMLRRLAEQLLGEHKGASVFPLATLLDVQM